MFLLWIFLFLTTSPIFSSDSLSSQKITIVFIKQNYEGNEPITLVFSIINTGQQEKTFLISDILYHSFSFDLRTGQNEKIPIIPSVEAQLSTSHADPSMYRKISLLPGESFSRICNLRDYFDIKSYENMYVRGIFYPNPDNRVLYTKTAFVSFTHIPPKIIQKEINNAAIQDEKDLKLLLTMPPYEIIVSMFDAQKKKNWKKFLLHFDCEKLIHSFSHYDKQYKIMEIGASKLRVLEKFKRYLSDHWNINLTHYEIIKTTIEDNSAYVTADATENIYAISRRIRYHFTLYQTKSGNWLIEDYAALVLN